MAAPLTTRYFGGPYDVVYLPADNPTAGIGFLLDRPSVEMRVSDFAPGINIGSDPAYSEGIFQAWTITGFQDGGDKKRFETGEKRFLIADGNVATQHQNYLTLASQWASTDTGVTASFRRIVDFSDGSTFNYILIANGTSVRQYNAGTATWGNTGAFGASVTYLFANRHYAFACFGSGTDMQRYDGTVWAAVAGIKADSITWFQEKLYRGLGNSLYAGTAADGSTWGVTPLTVGFDNTPITDMVATTTYLLICKPEGLYIFDGSTVYQVVDGKSMYGLNNWIGGAEWDGKTYLPLQNRVKQFTPGSTVRAGSIADPTSDMYGDDNKENYGHGYPKVAVAGPNLIYVAFDQAESSYPEVLAYNGTGWHTIYMGTSGQTMRALGYSRIMDWLLVNVGTTVYRKRVIPGQLGEYPDYALTGYVETPDYDAGLPDEPKAFRDITIKGRHLDDTHYIQVDYSTDRGVTWTTIGTIKSNEKRMSFAGLYTQVSGKTIRLRFTLNRAAGDVTVTPILEFPIVVRVLPVPGAVHAYEDVLALAPDTALREGHDWTVGESFSMPKALQILRSFETSTATIIRIDPYGRISRVKNTDFRMIDPFFNSLDKTWREPSVSVRWIDVFAGIYPQEDFFMEATFTSTYTLQAPSTYTLHGTGIWGLTVDG